MKLENDRPRYIGMSEVKRCYHVDQPEHIQHGVRTFLGSLHVPRDNDDRDWMML